MMSRHAERMSTTNPDTPMRCNAMTGSQLLLKGQHSAVGFTCRYMPGNSIIQADFSFEEHSAILYYADGSTNTITWDQSIVMDVYTQEYGVGISPDGALLFVPSWEMGITCLSAADGHILWQFRKKHARQIYCYDNFLICFFEGEALRRISYTGEELQRLPFSGDTTDCWGLADGPLLIGPKRGKFSLLHPLDLSVIRTIPQEAVISTAEDPYLIWNVTGTSDQITLHCWHNDTRITRELRPDDAP